MYSIENGEERESDGRDRRNFFLFSCCFLSGEIKVAYNHPFAAQEGEARGKSFCYCSFSAANEHGWFVFNDVGGNRHSFWRGRSLINFRF